MNRNPAARAALGAVLREFRRARELSQAELGLEAGVDRTYVGSVERGEQNLSFEALWQLLSALGVSWAAWGEALDAYAIFRTQPATPRARRGTRPRRRPAT